MMGLGCNSGSKTQNSNPDWSFSPLYGIPNVDDDDQDGLSDWEGSLNSQEDDLETLDIDSAYWNSLGDGEKLTLSQNSEGFRVYKDGELITNSEGDQADISNASSAYFEVEFLDYNTMGSLTLSNDSKSVDIPLQSAPLLINHHLQPAEMVYAMAYSGNGGNGSFINGLTGALGSRFTSYDLQTYGWDVWIQDEIEFGTLVSPTSRIDVVIDSIRDRGLDSLPEAEMQGSGTAVQTWGSGWATSQDSFGNLEATPPITVDGIEYPFGRIYYGLWRSDSIHSELRTFLEEQAVQSPVQLDVTWLCVGHVDEFMSFIPDPSSDKGFKLMVTDTTVGYEFFENLELETAYCSDETLLDQISCEDTGACSDANLLTQESCEEAGSCSDNALMDKESCELTGICSDQTLIDEISCTAAGLCSDVTIIDQVSCEAASSCSDPAYASQNYCEENNEIWTQETWTAESWTAETWTAESWTAEVWNSMELPKYSTDHHYDSVSEILNDTALRSLNEDIQMDYIEPNIESFVSEFGLVEDDIIRVPMLFEEALQCGSYTATLLPGTVNMIVAPDPNSDETDLIMPDPYFRENINNQASDPFIAHIESLLPEKSRPHWVDDWEWYHMALGEVHCGSNTKRTPLANWYESASHLITGDSE